MTENGWSIYENRRQLRGTNSERWLEVSACSPIVWLMSLDWLDCDTELLLSRLSFVSRLVGRRSNWDYFDWQLARNCFFFEQMKFSIFINTCISGIDRTYGSWVMVFSDFNRVFRTVFRSKNVETGRNVLIQTRLKPEEPEICHLIIVEV